MKQIGLPALIAGASLLTFWASGIPFERASITSFWVGGTLIAIAMAWAFEDLP
jgi:hypothetical protein